MDLPTSDRSSRKDRTSTAVSLLVFALLVFAPAGSGATTGIYGYGGKLCLDFVTDYELGGVRSLYTSWAQGYFSAISHREGLKEFTRGMGDDPAAMERWLKRYCDMRNSKEYHEAVEALLRELVEPRPAGRGADER